MVKSGDVAKIGRRMAKNWNLEDLAPKNVANGGNMLKYMSQTPRSEMPGPWQNLNRRSCMSIVRETWRAVVGYEGLYEISSYGQLNRLTSTRGTAKGIRAGSVSLVGYRVTTLTKNKTQRQHYIHALVAEAFVGPRPIGQQVNHKDGNKLNNFVDNLEYVTPGGNVRHAIALGLIPSGDDSKFSRLTSADVLKIRTRASAGEKYSNLSKEYCVSETSILHIARGIVRNEIGGPLQGHRYLLMTEEIEAEIYRLDSEGHIIAEIARRVGRGWPAVKLVLDRKGG